MEGDISGVPTDFLAAVPTPKAKIDVIERLPPPVTVKGIRSFLDHAGFYHHFIKDFPQIARPLTNLLAKDAPFEFTDECLRAFEILKKCNTRFIKGHKLSNHIHARIKSHVYTIE